MKLEGKVAIVTGSGRGIGRAIALAYAREGAKLVIADINSKNAADVAQEINDSISEAIAVETDVSKEDSVAQMVSKADERFGKVDILVANAAIQKRFFVHEFPVDVFRETLDVNLVGVFNCCKAVLKQMYQRKDGNIIMTASNSGKKGFAFNSAYCASKFGILGFMESLAAEAKDKKVRVNAICPTGVKTMMSDSVRRPNGQHYDSTHFMEPEEIADVALFLASDDSRALHGQSINVYGGVDYC